MRDPAASIEVQVAGDGPLECVRDPGIVWRVGFPPDPWAWAGWEYAGDDGRFPGRWDDATGNFRTIYAGSSLLACLVEVLAHFRADPLVETALADIEEDPEDAAQHPTIPAGTVDRSWLDQRQASRAELSGTYCAVTSSQTVATLRPWFIATAITLGLPDFDAAALKLARPRELTQRVATWLWEQTAPDGEPLVDGVQFASRHGDDHELWAVFERELDDSVSRLLTHLEAQDLRELPELQQAFELLGLTWA